MLGRPAPIFGLLLALASPTIATGWTAESYQTIAREAANIAPPDLRGQLERHHRDVLRGAVAPLQVGDPRLRVKNPDGSGQLDAAVLQATKDLANAIRTVQPFSEVAYRFGVLSHYTTLLNDPLAVVESDPAERRFSEDFSRYRERAAPRFALVFYADEPRVDTWDDVRSLVGRTLARGRSLYPLVGMEYRRVGFGSGVIHFDDRSTAFGIGAVSFSHAVTDIARLARWAWREGGGIDRGSPAELVRQPRVLVLPRDPGSERR